MANEMKTQAPVEQDAAQPVVDGKKVLLRLRDVKQYFPVKRTKLREKQRYVRANDGISLDIFEGETLGLVGESPAAASPRWAAPFSAVPPRATGTFCFTRTGRPST